MTAQIDASMATAPGGRQELRAPLDQTPLEVPTGMIKCAFALSPLLTAQLAAVAEREGVPVVSICLAAYAILLSRYSNISELNIWVSSDMWQRDIRSEKSNKCESFVSVSCLPNLRLRELLHAITKSVTAAAMCRASG